ncbi:hypothetical protein SUGI_0915760 [Cryptomeria japonica]|nr:hypothetical protein SUGI_0915760 [Cryptomeria japonica]
MKDVKFVSSWTATGPSSKALDESSDSCTATSISNTHNNHQNIRDQKTSSALEGNLKLNHFRKIKKIERGDSGTVFLAELSDTQTYFAVKVADGNNISNVRREIQVLKFLRSHPLFPTLFFDFRKDGKSYFVTEYCPADLDRLPYKQLGHRFSEDILRYG